MAGSGKQRVKKKAGKKTTGAGHAKTVAAKKKNAGKDRAGLIKENRALKLELQKMHYQMEVIRETSFKMTTELSLNRLLDNLVKTAVHFYKADAASCMLWNEHKDYLILKSGYGFNTDYVNKQQIPSEKIRQLVSGKQNYIYVEDLQKTPFGDVELVKQEELKSVLSVFMRFGHIFLGTINIYSRSRKRIFGMSDIENAQVFAQQAAVAVWNAYLYGEIYAEAQIAKTLLQVAEDVGTLDSLDEMLNRIVMIITRALKYKMSAIFLWDREKGFYTPVKAVGIPPYRTALFQTLILRKEELDFSEKEMKERATIIAGAGTTRFPVEKFYDVFNERDLRLVPLVVKNKLMGAIVSAGYEGDEPFDSKSDMFLRGIAAQAAIAIDDAHLFEALESAFWDIIKSLATAIEAKDHYTHSHSQSVIVYGTAIAKTLGLPKQEVELIGKACLLHDLGKIGVEDGILRKVTPLTPAERKEIEKHPVIGANILNSVNSLTDIAKVVRHHHENYDGSGYPDHLKGEEIPLHARILQIADSFDAMTSDRPYRKAMTREEAVEQLKTNAGCQFDPDLVDVFLHTLDDIK